MKINYVTGCTHNDLKVDKIDANNLSLDELKNVCKRLIDENNLSLDELKNVCKRLIDENNDKDSLQQIIIMDYLYQIGPTDSYRCEQCGDFVEIFELEING